MNEDTTSQRLMPSRETMQRLPHLTLEYSQETRGAIPYHVNIVRKDNTIQEAIVWSTDIHKVHLTINHHYGTTWSSMRLIENITHTQERDRPVSIVPTKEMTHEHTHVEPEMFPTTNYEHPSRKRAPSLYDYER